MQNEVNTTPKATEAKQQQEAEIAKCEKETQEWENGPAFQRLCQIIRGLPYTAKLTAVLMGDIGYLENQAGFHEGLSKLMWELHEEVIAPENRPSDPQLLKLLNLYQLANLASHSDDTERWRSLVETWADSTNEAEALQSEAATETSGDTEQRILDYFQSLDEKGKLAVMMCQAAQGADGMNGWEMTQKINDLVESWENEPTQAPDLQWMRGIIDGIQTQNAQR
ncbi:hypothetical protein ACFL6U_12800 [Planctomycetota bacterium]